MPFLTNILHPWKLPAERNFGWKMKPLGSAQTTFTVDNNSVFTLTIDHDTIHGVTPKMLVWWFQNLGGQMMYQEKLYPNYLVWHPKDHIHWRLVNASPDNTIGPGSRFRIVEALDRNMKFLIDSTELVVKLDETGIRLIKQIGNTEIFSLQHDFIPHGNNTIYKSRMIVGTNKKPFGKLFNNYVRPLLFSEEMGYAWLKHNIEEVGNLEFFLPELYELKAIEPQSAQRSQ
jgi:hypothetical protein